MNPIDDFGRNLTRRYFFKQGSHALGWGALASLLMKEGLTPQPAIANELGAAAAIGPHFPGQAKQVIYLHMVGGPSQLDLFDYKPQMAEWYDKDLPETIRNGQRLTTMTSGQTRFPIAPSMFKFAQHGESGMWVSEMFPWKAKMVDDLCFIRSMSTEAINHEPAITFMQTGNQITGKPCFGSWASYGLGSLNDNLPSFVVLVAEPTNNEQPQAISARLWSSGFLPGQYAGVSFRSSGDPILYINNPNGVPTPIRRSTLDSLSQLNHLNYQQLGDPETLTRIKQYELAFKMQSSVPDLTDLSQESKSTLDMYGEFVHKPGSFAQSVLLARRMVERGVRFVQIYHNNWDWHGNTAGRSKFQCKDVDQPCYALIQDLKQRGLLDSTIVLWGGEFGRTIYTQGKLSKENYGRDHHPRCFTMWAAGGGFKGGKIYGETDEFSYNVIKDKVPVRDLHATLLHQLGFDHSRFTVKNQGLDVRLTGVEEAHVVHDLIS
jgi:hypothetical protein